MAKKYYWLKLKSDFFNQREIKKLRRLAGGETLILIYIKMLLLALKNQGIIVYEATEQDIYEQLALELDENIDDVKLTISFLNNHNLAEMNDEQDLILHETKVLIGSESESTKRVRKHRQKQLKMGIPNKKALHCNGDVTKCNTDIQLELDTESDIELDKELNTLSDQVEELRSILKKYYGNAISMKFGTKNVSDKLKMKLKKYDYERIKTGFENYLAVNVKNGISLKYIKAVEAFLYQETFNDYQVIEESKNKLDDFKEA